MTRNVSEYSACRVPLRRVPFGDAFLVVHEGAVASVKRIEARWLAKGGNSAYRIRREDTGAYNCRRTTSGRSMSKHSWGCAIDFNWSTNGYGASNHDIPDWFVQLFADEGWGWGGNWRGTKDWMHVSKFVNEGGDGLLYVGEEEDWLDMATKDELEALIKANVAAPLQRLLDIVEETVTKPDGSKIRTDGIKLIRQEIAALDVPRKAVDG